MGISLGQVVVSRAGRDAGRRFVVVKVVDDFFVEIADGDLRKIEKPKRKKVKHLNITDERAFGIEEKLKSGAKITNAEIRKALADLDF
ncbi:MAG: RNA-binding protein [Acetivibrionales bacterium]